MALDFPISPALDEVYTFGGRSWKWNGLAWDSVTAAYGPVGPTGPPGPTGPAGTVFYHHIQSVPSTTWVINHNLNGFPTAVVIDSAGTQWEGLISYGSINQMTITFSAAFGGTAYVI